MEQKILVKCLNKNSLIRHVQVIIEFSRIGEIDTMNEKYTAEFYIEAKWIEKKSFDVYDPKV